MSIQPLVTFKAGMCVFEPGSSRVSIDHRPGYVYVYLDDDFTHFCWRTRSASLTEPEIDLIMIPGDATFTPYLSKSSSSDGDSLRSPTKGRVFRLRFVSSPDRHLFWLQSKTQHPQGDESWFSPRDRKLGEIVDALLSGDEINVPEELANMQRPGGSGDDDPMEGVEDTDPAINRHGHGGTGGAGAGATGGDIREEGEESREGGADGARAVSSNDAVVQSIVDSFRGVGPTTSGSSNSLNTLCSPKSAEATINDGSVSLVDKLCAELPQKLFQIPQADPGSGEPYRTSDDGVQPGLASLTLEQKKAILKRVVTSPQYQQGVASLNAALREGALPNVSQALGISVKNGGRLPGGFPMSGGQAIQAFVEGLKQAAIEERKRSSETKEQTDDMDLS